MEPDELNLLDAQIEKNVTKLVDSDLESMSLDDLAKTHVNFRDLMAANNARQKANDLSIKTCLRGIEGAVGERLSEMGVRSAVVPSGLHISNKDKVVYNTTDAKELLHWAVANGKEHLLSVGLVSSACIAEFDKPENPPELPEFVCRVEIPETKVTRN